MSGKARAVRGGGRAVEVAPERLAGWFDRFGARNGGVVRTSCTAHTVMVSAANGSTATVEVPFPPLPEPGKESGLAVEPLVAHVLPARRIGLLLVRLGGYSIGIADGTRIVTSRTDRRLVHGRSAAGGWSQQRFARRRAGQARDALRATAADVLDVLVPRVADLDAVVLGGDRGALAELRADSRLAPVFALAIDRVLNVPEPRRAVLTEAAARARTVEIVIRDTA